MSAESVVFVGFNPDIWSDFTDTVILPFIKKLQALGFVVAVPKGVLFEHCVETENLSSGQFTFCLFLARPLKVPDTVLTAQIDQARRLDLKRHGFIFTGDKQRYLVPVGVIEMFRNRSTDFCNAIHSVEELIQCLDYVAGL